VCLTVASSNSRGLLGLLANVDTFSCHECVGVNPRDSNCLQNRAGYLSSNEKREWLRTVKLP
jgi:hypothetical protein